MSSSIEDRDYVVYTSASTEEEIRRAMLEMLTYGSTTVSQPILEGQGILGQISQANTTTYEPLTREQLEEALEALGEDAGISGVKKKRRRPVRKNILGKTKLIRSKNER